jgi:putative N6-adenine-specific DNA methylase
MELLAKTFQGLEQILADELIALGANNVQLGKRAVSFEGDMKMVYKANYLCRYAIRILIPIYTFKAKTTDAFYAGIQKIDWSKYIDLDQTLAIDSVVFSRIFTHSQYISLKTKDAIVDQFRDKFGKRPDVKINQPDLHVNIYLLEDTVVVSLDSSGDTLNKRGYRLDALEAPINEVLAAGMLKIAKWDAKTDFFDPMCGSGTFLVEAAMYALNMPASYLRDYFSFKHWKDYDPKLWDEVVNEAKANTKEKLDIKIYGSDFSFQAMRIAERNIEAIRLEKYITLSRKDFFKTYVPLGTLVMMNPPYDERMKIDDVGKFYSELGHYLKSHYQGSTVWVISSQKSALGNIPMRPSSTFPLFNGALECKFVKYEVFSQAPKRDNPVEL